MTGHPVGGIACVGNWIVDIVHSIDLWPQKSDLVHIRDETVGVGGGAANVAMDLAAFDAQLPVLAVGLLGRDLHAATVRAACMAAGVDAGWLADTADAPTAHTHVMNVPGDSRTFFYHPGTNDLLGEAEIPVEALAEAGVKIVYLGYLNLLGRLDHIDPDGSTAAARVLRRAQAAGMLTCVDLVSADSPQFRQTVAAALPHIDMLFLNEVEAQRATGVAVDGPSDRAGFASAAAVLLAGGAGTVVVHSPALSLWHKGGEAPFWATPAPVDPQRIVSPVGAGDAFCAGAIYAMHQGWPVARALRLAHAAAAAALGGSTATDAVPSLAILTQGWDDI
jgi:sugar/nucleoside kinase (ribokinase family)